MFLNFNVVSTLVVATFVLAYSRNYNNLLWYSCWMVITTYYSHIVWSNVLRCVYCTYNLRKYVITHWPRHPWPRRPIHKSDVSTSLVTRWAVLVTTSSQTHHSIVFTNRSLSFDSPSSMNANYAHTYLTSLQIAVLSKWIASRAIRIK